MAIKLSSSPATIMIMIMPGMDHSTTSNLTSTGLYILVAPLAIEIAKLLIDRKQCMLLSTRGNKRTLKFHILDIGHQP